MVVNKLFTCSDPNCVNSTYRKSIIESVFGMFMLKYCNNHLLQERKIKYVQFCIEIEPNGNRYFQFQKNIKINIQI